MSAAAAKIELPQCTASTKKGTTCTKHVSRQGEEFCVMHGGLTKAGKPRKAAATKATAVKQVFLCGSLNADGKSHCKHHVKNEGETCPTHRQSHKTTFDSMNLDFIKAFDELKDNKLMRALAKWYLQAAELGKDRELTEKEWERWIAGGRSNAAGDSFGEIYKGDPMIVLVNLPSMAKHRDFLLGKYEELAQNPHYGAVKHGWERYLATLDEVDDDSAE